MSEYDDDPTPQPIIVRPRTPMESLGETITRVGTGVIPSRKTTYHGIVMRSRLEVRFARHLDELGERWVYEPRVFGSKGSGYLPDFEILDGGRPIYVEVKPTLAEVPAAKAKASVIWQDIPRRADPCRCRGGLHVLRRAERPGLGGMARAVGRVRAYHRVDPLMDERKGHYTPAQLGAFLKVQLVAGRQTNRGHFRSVAALRAILPATYTRHVDFLLAEGDLDVLADGSVYVDGWREWQEGDLTVKDRMARLRNRQRNGTVTPTVTRPSPTAIRSSVGVGIGVGGDSYESPATRANGENYDGRADLEMFLLLRRRAPTPKQRRLLDEVMDRHDLTGPEWAADVMVRHPDDPIGAVIEADKAWRAVRIAEAQAADPPKPKPRRKRGLPQTTREIMAEMALLRGEPA